ncbi:MAG: hypothetical protein AUI54_02990 [Acidobacteria bacterium 13_1_40CM_2_56_5]|nr:MAG: hypothetical protein AUI54_02990 [Acidobacteria bacterium 13_1_40CM_2_56_5]
MDDRGHLEVGRITKLAFSAVVVIVALIIVFGSFIIVPAGTRGVVLTWGAFNGEIFDPGLHFKMPIAQNVVLMNVQTAKIEVEKSESYSHDLQVVDIHSVVNYNIDPQAVGTVYQQYGLDFEGKLLTPNVEAAVKQTIAKYTAEDLLGKRSEVQSEIEDTIKQAFPKAFVVTKYALVNEQFSDVFEKAIEAKQVAQQEAEKASNELKKATIDAESRVAQAKGEAEAIKIQAEAITQQGGAAYVELKRVEKWNGQYPTTYMGSGATPLFQVK